MSPRQLRVQVDPEVLEAFVVYRSGPFCVVRCTRCRTRIRRERARITALALVYLACEHAWECFAPPPGPDGAGS